MTTRREILVGSLVLGGAAVAQPADKAGGTTTLTRGDAFLGKHMPKPLPFDPKKLVGAQAVKHAQDEGLIVRPIGDTISICPPLVIKPAEIDELFDKLEVALDKTLDWAKREQLLAA